MKALLYKEFRLSWHPLCYILPILFSFTVLIPQYPPYIGLMMVTITYTILFLGANKGKQSNDLYFTSCLPVRKQDIVIARFISLLTMQLMVIVISWALSPASALITKLLGNKPFGFKFECFGLVISFAILCYIICDACYMLMFYKKGKSIVAPSLISMFAFLIIMVVFTTVLPLLVPNYNNFFTKYIWIQFVCLAIAITIYAISHIFIIKKATKLIKNINL